MSMLPNLLFFRSYRPSGVYTTQLEALGLADVTATSVALDSEWYLVTGRKP
jgi:hypothetical protein